MGLALAEEKYGRLGLARVMAPAIRLAKNGFPVSDSFAHNIRSERALLQRFDGSRHLFLRNGNLYEPGAVFRQPDLARTLAAITKRGPQAFYSGAPARALVATMRKYNGLITREDLEHYQAKLRPPLVGHFRGFDILTTPPPSAGGTMLVEMLNVLEPIDLGTANSYSSIHLIAETMRRAYADRATYLGDTDFASVPVAGLTSPRYAAQLRADILGAHALFGCRRGGQCGGEYLYLERVVWMRRDRGRRGVSA
jgi:gamma-glutamyltranspeptidase/glutathione hydrolase